MADRIVGQPVLLIPESGIPVQHRNAVGTLLLQAGAEEVGEQLVVTPPAADIVEGHQEQPGGLDRLQHRLAVGPTSDRIAQRATEPVQHRRLQEECAHPLRLPVQHLLGQIVEDVAMAATECGHELRNVHVAP